MNRNLESLLRKTGRILATSFLLTMPYRSFSEGNVEIEYKDHVISEDLNKDSRNEEIYVTTEAAPLPYVPGKVVVNDTHQIVFKYLDKKSNEEVKSILKTGIDDEVKKLLLKDMNESNKPKENRKADLVYIIELDYDKGEEKGHRYEIHYFPRSSDLSFSSSVFVGGYDEIPEEYR